MQIQNCYRIKGDYLTNTETPSMGLKDFRPRQAQSIGYLGDTVEAEAAAAAASAAYKIVVAENKSFVAAEAVKEAEKVLGWPKTLLISVFHIYWFKWRSSPDGITSGLVSLDSTSKYTPCGFPSIIS
ncbi:unnamed protein product [Fraxinus pennsylvanica]|uniref:Uncharacterized protein n=1 Tax=Fraxinus pennsylvanica TaxID=56036 RepID=A0AAD2A7N9_9LAMI|nr:unnamed protein product [Fraxinus pennsylvanica]